MFANYAGGARARHAAHVDCVSFTAWEAARAAAAAADTYENGARVFVCTALGVRCRAAAGAPPVALRASA